MIELFGSALVTFLVIIDPPGCAPIFASLTRGAPDAQRRSMAIRSSLIAWVILMFFALLGRPMLHALGISLASFRIAGGIMLFFIAIDLVFERRPLDPSRVSITKVVQVERVETHRKLQFLGPTRLWAVDP